MNKLFVAVGVILIASLVGCTQTASIVSQSEAQDIANNLTYVKDSRNPNHQACFAVVASRHVAEFHQNGLTITWVPLEMCK
jgi:hypothetical protein